MGTRKLAFIMPTIQTIEREIRDFEGFSVKIRSAPAKRDVRSDKTNVPGYKKRYLRIARNTFTVDDWRRRRFELDYPGFEVDVLRPDGKVATGKTGLAKLRAAYERATE